MEADKTLRGQSGSGFRCIRWSRRVCWRGCICRRLLWVFISVRTRCREIDRVYSAGRQGSLGKGGCSVSGGFTAVKISVDDFVLIVSWLVLTESGPRRHENAGRRSRAGTPAEKDRLDAFRGSGLSEEATLAAWLPFTSMDL